NYIISLKAFFNFLVEIKFISFDPMENIKPQQSKTEYTPRWLDPSEKRFLIRFIEDPMLKEKNSWKYSRNKFIIFSMLHAGLRISEVTNLTIYDFRNGYISVREGKGQAARDIPMNKTLLATLDEWLIERNKKNPKTDYLLVSQKGGKLTVSGIYNLFEKIVEATKLNDLTPHTLRHTFAHDLIEKGHPITYVAALLGHNDLDTTRIYTSPRQQNLKDAVESLSDE
ncbi:tyrosine-type recombinase/integrase, partial [Streptomyces sp. NPDC057062]